MDWGSIISGAISLYGSMESKKKEGKAMDAYAEGLRLLQQIVPPSLQELTVQLSDAVLQGQITPEEFTAYLQEESAMEGIEIPQEIVDAQFDTLRQLDEIVNQGGLTAIDRARLNDIKNEVATQARGRGQALKQEFAQRGMSGSGLEIASRLQSESTAAQNASKMGFDVAAEAQKRVLDALTQKGQQANTMRGQSFNEQSSKAQAQDAINRFNTGQLQATSDRNVAASNAAQAANLAERQRISDMNTSIHNQQAQNNANARQQQFQNEVSRAGGMANQSNAMGNAYLGAAERDENQYAALASTLGGMFGDDEKDDDEDEDEKKTVSDERLKTDISELSDDDVDQILDSLTGHKFKYARSVNKPGLRAGVMAQELESTPAGADMVSEEKGVKKVDNAKALHLALGALANQNKRIRALEGQ